MKHTARLQTCILALGSLLLISMACTFYDQVREEGIDPGSGVELPPDFPTPDETMQAIQQIKPTQTRADENSSELPLTECLAPENTYRWSHENPQVITGKDDRACVADFVVENTGAQPMTITLREKFDNNAMRWDEWKHYRLEPGARLVKRISQAEYEDGTVTYSLLTRLFVTRVSRGCNWIISTEFADIWEDRSQHIDLPCN